VDHLHADRPCRHPVGRAWRIRENPRWALFPLLARGRLQRHARLHPRQYADHARRRDRLSLRQGRAQPGAGWRLCPPCRPVRCRTLLQWKRKGMREDPVEGNTVNSSSRRHFLKSGALVAAPLAAMAVPAAAMAAPAAAQADDGTAQALARLKDERALRDMQRALLRETEAAARGRIAGLVEGAGTDIAAIRPDRGSDSTLAFS